MSEHDFSGTHRRTVRARSFPPEPTFALEDEPWMGDAVCPTTDPDAFFPEHGGSTRDTKSICAVCPVREACLQYALDHNERFGVWGGLSERERRRLMRGVA